MVKQPQTQVRKGPDGYDRPAEQEDQLNKTFASVFAGPNGQLVLGYLRSITVNTAITPNDGASNVLWHREGMRTLYAIIDNRVQLGHQANVVAAVKAKQEEKKDG